MGIIQNDVFVLGKEKIIFEQNDYCFIEKNK